MEHSLEQRLKALVDRAAQETGASYAFLLLGPGDNSPLSPAIWWGWEGAPRSCQAVARWVLSQGRPVCLRGPADVRQIMGDTLDKAALPLICAPVTGHGVTQAVLALGRPQARGKDIFSWLALVEAWGALAGAFLENDALQLELSHKEEQLRHLAKDILEAQEAERERICLEVHDGVTQTVVAAFRYLQTLETILPEGTPARPWLLRASGLLRQAIQESREVINGLQPASLRDLGLVATLRQEVRHLEQETGWQVEFRADAVRFPHDIEIGLYRILREAITNARKHADTERLRVSIAWVEDQVRAEVQDWGVGFQGEPLGVSRRRGTGLLSMRRRAELLQGVCDIDSKPGQGTTICVRIPVSSEEEPHGQDKGAFGR